MINEKSQAYLNKVGFLKSTHNQVRLNKETKNFKKVDTRNYMSIVDEMKDLHEYEYICAGLNSFEREVVIIDTDDETFGKKTMELLTNNGLVPHCQKVKSNGHSQTYFFIRKHRIGYGYFFDKKYKEVDYQKEHDQWKRLTKMINFLFNGDICYTGYNCQNPYYDNANITFYKDVNERYTIDELYNVCIEKLSHVEDLDRFLKTMRLKALNNKNENKVKVQQNQYQESIITNDTVSVEETEKAIDNAINEYETSINKRIFVVCCQIAKSFKTRNLLNFDNFDEISRTAYNNFINQDYAYGYSCQDVINRVRADIREIIIKDMYNKMEWNKVGYTKEQRERSLKTRQDKKENRKNVIREYLLSIITNGMKLSQNKMAKAVKAEYNIKHPNDKISDRTAIRYVKEILTENENKVKVQRNQYQESIITNGTLSNMVEEALKDESEKKVVVKKIKKIKKISNFKVSA